MTSTPRLEALDWLGRGIDLTSPNPFSIDSVKTLIKNQYIISTQDDHKTHTVTIGDVQYTVPSIVSATEDGAGAQNSKNNYRNGSEALRNFETDSRTGAYLAVHANSSSSYPLAKSFPNNYQFYFFSSSIGAYSASLRDYIDFINEKLLLKKVQQLPKPFVNDPIVVKAYRQFFGQFGTHVITGATYGGWCNLSVWASNAYSEVNDNWVRDVTAMVRGINDGGLFDESALGEPQYQIFNTIAQTLFTAKGGDQALAESLMQGQYNFDVYKKWFTSTISNPTFVSMVVTELWSVLRNSNNAELRDSADAIEDAFNAIVSQQQQEQQSTLVILEGDSDLTEFGFLTPSATVGVGGPLPSFDPATQNVIGLSETKVRWGHVGIQPKSVIIPFYVVNDGSPIDLYVRRESGTVKVTINGNTYTGEEWPDNKTTRFYQVPVKLYADPKD